MEMTRAGVSGCDVRGDAANLGSRPRLLILLSGRVCARAEADIETFSNLRGALTGDHEQT